MNSDPGDEEDSKRGKRQTSNAKLQTPNGAGNARTYDLGERLLEYAARIIRLVDSMRATKSATHVGGQLLRSGTAPLSSHGEAQAAESIDDFIHKLKIAHKELQESWRWLRLIRITPLIAKPKRIDPLVGETEELIRIFAKSLQTAEARRDNRMKETPPESIDPWLLLFPLAFEVWRSKFGVNPPSDSRQPCETKYPQAPRRKKSPRR